MVLLSYRVVAECGALFCIAAESREEAVFDCECFGYQVTSIELVTREAASDLPYIDSVFMSDGVIHGPEYMYQKFLSESVEPWDMFDALPF